MITLLIISALLTGCMGTTTTSTTTKSTEKTTTTSPPVSSTSATTTTTTSPSYCTGVPDNLCVDPNCTNSQCVCDDRYFLVNGTVCLSETGFSPRNLTVGNITTNSLEVKWSIDSYFILTFPSRIQEVYVMNTTERKECQSNGSCSDLTPGYRYNVTVRVNYTTENGVTVSQHNSVQESLFPDIPGSLSDNLDLSAPNVTLSWSPPQGRVDKYNVKVLYPNGTVFEDQNTTVSNTSITELNAGYNYSVEIVAYSYNKESMPMNDTFRTNTEEPGPPSSLNVSQVNNTLLASWLAPDNPNGDIVGYIVCYKSKVYVDLEYGMPGCEAVTEEEYSVSPITAGTFYIFEVYTTNDKYNSTESTNFILRTNESEPGMVSSLSATSTNTSIKISWERPKMPNGNIVAYKVQWSKSEDPFIANSVCLNSNASRDSLCIANSTDRRITENEANTTYIIQNLMYYTEYTITVWAFTNIGNGSNATMTWKTSIAAPDPVEDVTADALNSTAVNVSWTIPAQNPGPVNYTVTTTDLVFNNISSKSCVVRTKGKNYTTSSCVITGLEAFWKYAFSVAVQTEEGKSEEVISNITFTKPAVPGKVSSFTVKYYNGSNGNCDATKVTLQWTEPALLQRNANITRYKFEGSDIPDFTVADPDPYRLENRNFTTDISLEAESPFSFTLSAVGGNLTGEQTNVTGKTGVCAPPRWTSSELEKVDSAGMSTTTVTIALPSSLFSKNTQGEIQEKGLIVIPENSRSNNIIDVDRVGSWKMSSRAGFRNPYKIVLDTYSGGNFIIGNDASCRSEDETTFCNGELPSSFKFRLAIFSCTMPTLCTVGDAFGLFYTSAPPKATESSNTWVIAVAVLIVLAAAVGAFAFLWWQGVIDPKSWLKKNDDVRDGNVPFTDIVENINRPRPIKVADYNDALEDMHRDTNLKFSDQYDDISKLGDFIRDKSTMNAAKLESNTAKNRWVNILPYDHSRVKLQQIDEDDPSSDYINANYMPGFNSPREYIATQGPLPGTIDDFWRLVWEHKVQVIVMLTQCKEGNRVKCEKYWPDELREPKQYGDVVVSLISISQLDKYNISIFHVSVNGINQQVIHFHYLDFPDFSANVEFDHFIEFVRTVRNHVPRDMVGPMIVHCSAGVGRTGTFIAVDRLQNYLNSPQFSEEDSIDIFEMVMSMRQNRVYMVQTESQYIMIHDCFKKMLEDKRAQIQVSASSDNLYVNEAFDQYPEPVYENVESSKQRTEL